MAHEMKSVNTYMAIPEKIDPAHIISMADLEISVALASTLVSFDQQRQVTASLAQKWSILPPRKIQFQLRDNLTWSDSTPITAMDFKVSLERAKRDYPNDLKALFDVVKAIKAIDTKILEIETKSDVEKSGILLKLTEPMYGLLAISDGKVVSSKTSGPYFIRSVSKTEMTLEANTNWFKYRTDMPQIVNARALPIGVDIAQRFQSDNWVNLISTSSLLKKNIKEELESSGVKFWQRSMDKVFSLYPSARFLENGGSDIIKYIGSQIQTNELVKGLTGLQRADQFFPRGYELWSSSPPQPDKDVKLRTPRKIDVLIPETGYATLIKENIQRAFENIQGIKATVNTVKLSDLNESMKKGDYDILATGLAVADPNFEGAMSFFFERSPAFITSSRAPYNFSAQVKTARELPTSKDRANAMRAIVIKAQESGHVLPLFHFSSMAMSKGGVDLSQIPNSDETVLFWKVRMK